MVETKQKTINNEIVLQCLLENAFDFLERGIEQFEHEPKYSVINFCSAVELFLKARLLKEHWALVVAKNPKMDEFLKGDFKSINFVDLIPAIKNIQTIQKLLFIAPITEYTDFHYYIGSIPPIYIINTVIHNNTMRQFVNQNIAFFHHLILSRLNGTMIACFCLDTSVRKSLYACLASSTSSHPSKTSTPVAVLKKLRKRSSIV